MPPDFGFACRQADRNCLGSGADAIFPTILALQILVKVEHRQKQLYYSDLDWIRGTGDGDP